MAYVVKQATGRGQTHVYIAVNHHDPSKRQARQSRTYLGVLDQATGELLLGAKSREPDAATRELLKAKGIAYAGRRASPPGPKPAKPRATRPAAEIVGTLSRARITEVGRVEALSLLSNQSGLFGALESAYGEGVAERVLSVAMYQACEGGAMYLAGEWAEETGAPEGLSSASLSRLAAELGSDTAGADTFFRSWIVACGKPTALVHDTTSISSYAADLDLAEWGYNRDGEDLPQVNLALVVARESRLPLWFRVVPGSVPDVSTLKLTGRMLLSLGLERFAYSLDRGYYSLSNLKDMLEAKLGFTIGVPLGNARAKALVAANRRALAAVKRAFLYRDERVHHIEDVFTVETKNGAKTLPAHLYFDPARREAMSKRIETAVLELERKGSEKPFERWSQSRDWIRDNAGRLAKFLTPSGREGQWKVARKSNALAKAMNDFGLTLIVTTSPDHAAETTLSDYRCRDMAEKVFDTCKNATGNRRLHTGDEATAQGRLFLAFLAVTLRCLVESKLRQAKLLKSYTVDEVFASLRKIKRIQLADGNSAKLEVPKKTRLVAEALGLVFK